MSISSDSSVSTVTMCRGSATRGGSDINENPPSNQQHQNSLANKMRGIGKRISRFRSRSAERVSQRNRGSPERQEREYQTSKPETSINYSYLQNQNNINIGDKKIEKCSQDKTSGSHTIITLR